MNESMSEQIKVRGGSVDEALAHGHSLLDSHPQVALKQAEILLRSGADPRALRLAAAAHRKLGGDAQAEAAELAAIRAGFADPDLERAAIAQESGRFSDAEQIASSVLAREPDDLLALTIGAEAAVAMRRFDLAEARLRTVIERAPTFLRARLLNAKSLALQARIREAIAEVAAVLERKPDNEAALTATAQLRAEAGDHEEAAEAYRRLVELNPDKVEQWVIFAQHLRIVGNRDESRSAFRRALELDPFCGSAWWGLAQFFAGDLTEDDVVSMHEVPAARPGTPTDEASTRMALGIVEERRSHFAEAFEQFSEAKRLRLLAKPYDPDALTRDVDRAVESLTSALFADRSGYPDAAPIFLIGMPRSGSTLVERILGQHPAIEAAGELQLLPKIVEELRYRAAPGNYANLIASRSSEELAELGQRYVELAQGYRHSDKPRFIDKFNFNWLHAGLIRLILPNARIIDVRRDAVDCCWSNFKMLFSDNHADDLRHVARQYRDYVRLIDHVDEVAPGRILRVRYEDVVDDVEKQTRRMLEFLNLPYDERCIDFHLSDAPVATPSSEQVRQPINRNSIGSAKPYRQWLGPLVDELGPLAGA